MIENTGGIQEILIDLDQIDPLILFGENDGKLKLIKKTFPNVKITSRGTKLKIVGEDEAVLQVKEVFENMIGILQNNKSVSKQAVEELVSGQDPMVGRISDSENNNVIVYGRDGRPIDLH